MVTLLIRQPQLSGNPTISRLVENQEKFGGKNDEFSLRSIFAHTSK
jgi:hypothetical protein